jgi:hypothetical protein
MNPITKIEGKKLVFRLVFKTSNGRIIPAVAGSIPALSAKSSKLKGLEWG